ncbi:MAG: molybdopterin-dependent oxidoreductase [Oscillospiraceae bacterium]|nr:molybdopterin-dependent oxidoreductase [Oscillospiraceae bacterium]
MVRKKLIVNGITKTLVLDDKVSLADVLRKQMMLTGCKIACNQGQCGACNVLVNGKITRACITKMSRIADGAEITTVEGIGHPGHLHPVQVAWMAYGCAQCGFCSPGFIVSAKALLDQNLNPTREEVRNWFSKNRNLCRCTGYKPLVDAVMAAAKVMRGEISADELIFKPTQNRIYGTRYIRPSALAKVTGQWDFAGDDALKMPEGTLWLALTQAKVSHANIKGIDTSEAEKMPGVCKVITWKDAPGKNRINGLTTAPTSLDDGWERPILCDKKVFQFGDAIAIVAADTEAHARAAADKVKVDLEILPAYMSGPEAIAPDAMQIHPGMPNHYFTSKCIKGEETAPIIEKAKYKVTSDAFCSRQPHLALEPDCGLGYYDEKGRVTIHSKSIGVHLHHAMICEGLGLKPEELRLIQSNAGGTFGYKFSPTIEALIAVAVMVTKKPCVLLFDMFQGITYTGKRSPIYFNISAAADASGKIVAMESEGVMDHGPYSEFGDLLIMRTSQFVGCPYSIDNLRFNHKLVATNHAYGAAFRAYGSPQAYMASETIVDMLAYECGIDPWEFRYKNAMRPGQVMSSGCEPDVYCVPQLLEMIKPAYDEYKKIAKENSTDEVKWGVGVACGVYGCGLDGGDSSSASAELLPDGNVMVRTTWEDHGQGSDITAITHAHETLRPAGFTPNQIKLEMNDTANCPNGGPAGGSRSNIMVGNAISIACAALLKALDKGDGTYRTYEELTAEKKPTLYDGTYTASFTHAVDENFGQGNPTPTYVWEAFVPLVSVNVKTGKVHVEKFTTSIDCGTITNRLVTDGQIYGGIAQGIGLALTEDFDDLTKHISYRACGIPDIKDIPDDFNILYLESPRKESPHGASGLGEGPLTAPHPAVLNAIYAACGARVTKVPALPEVVLEALAEAKK